MPKFIYTVKLVIHSDVAMTHSEVSDLVFEPDTLPEHFWDLDSNLMPSIHSTEIKTEKDGE